MQASKEINVTSLYADYVLDNSYDCVVQVGGRFSGKSYNEQIRLVSNLASKKDYKLLVIEDLETGMSEGFHAGLYARIRDFEHEMAYTPESKVAHIKNTINNNTAIFRGYSSEQQKLNVKKLSGITEIVVEEGEWMTYNDFMGLYQQLRGGREEDRKLTILMNPVNPDCFVNEYLIEQEPDKVLKYFPNSKRPKVFERHIKTTFDFEGEEIEKTIVVLVVLSTHYDNEFLTLEQRASIEQYRITDPDLYLQLGEARFIASKGAFFKEFKKEIHVIEPFPIPSHWRRYRTLDYGLDMLACYWIAVDTYNNAYIYKELYESDLIISDAAKRIIEVNGNDNITLTYAPPDLENRRQDTGKSAFDIFRANGVSLTRADNKRVDGWLAMKEWLKPYESKDEQTGEQIKTSKLKIFSNCSNLIRCLPQVQKDEKDPNDVANTPHELTHSVDGIRYWCIMRTRPTDTPKTKPKRDPFAEKETNSLDLDDSYINMGR